MNCCHAFAFTFWEILAKRRTDVQRVLSFADLGTYVGK